MAIYSNSGLKAIHVVLGWCLKKGGVIGIFPIGVQMKGLIGCRPIHIRLCLAPLPCSISLFLQHFAERIAVHLSRSIPTSRHWQIPDIS